MHYPNYNSKEVPQQYAETKSPYTIGQEGQSASLASSIDWSPERSSSMIFFLDCFDLVSLQAGRGGLPSRYTKPLLDVTGQNDGIFCTSTAHFYSATGALQLILTSSRVSFISQALATATSPRSALARPSSIQSGSPSPPSQPTTLRPSSSPPTVTESTTVRPVPLSSFLSHLDRADFVTPSHLLPRVQMTTRWTRTRSSPTSSPARVSERAAQFLFFLS